MNWGNINLEEALKKVKTKEYKHNPDKVLEAFQELLKIDDALDDRILESIFFDSDEVCKINFRLIDPDRIFTSDQIKKLCTDYRLRFLSTKYFKGDIPHEAIAKIKRLQRNTQTELRNFKVLAPAPMFNLVDKDKDPLLFLSLGNERYYFIHKWGTDLSPFRKLLVFPFRSFKTVLFTVALLALLVVMCIPNSVIMGPYDTSSLNLRVIFFFYLFLAFSGLTVLYGFSRVKNFNGELWDSRYLD